MSLQVWLPLNRDLHNQGLSNVTVTNNGATIDNSGKIGKCYSFNGNDSYISLSSNKLYDIFKGGSQSFSISFWVYHADTTRAVLFGDYALTGAINFNIELTEKHKIRFYWGSSPDKHFTPAITQAQWTHIVLTYDGSKILFFIDGVLQIDKYSNTLAARNKTSGAFYLGRDNRTGTTALNGKLNDFRIYDHALSAKEVEEISKGLVLHYPLNNVTNWLLPNSKKELIRLQSGNNFQDYDYYPDLISSTETSWIVDFYAKGTKDDIQIDIYFRNSSSNAYVKTEIISLTTSLKHYSLSLTGSPASLDIFRFRCYQGIKGGTVTIYNMRLLSNNMPIRDNIIYDTSGYCNNGEIVGNLLSVNSSPKYNTSLQFDGTSAIAAKQGGKIKDAISICCWGYLDNWNNYLNRRLISCTEGGGWNFENNSEGKIQFALGTGTSSNTYKNVKLNKTWAELSSGWHFFVGTYDGFSVKLYIDGELEGENVAYETKTPIYYYTNGVFIGAESGVSLTTPAGYYFNGKISDVRIYATALSINQIKELYNTSLQIDSSGNIYARELVE